MLVEACKISKSIKDKGLEHRQILKSEPENYKLYESIVKVGTQNLKDMFGDGPTVLLRKFLDDFILKNKELSTRNFSARGFTYLGRRLNSYTWACIAINDKDTGKIKYRNNPQLYIGIQNDGLYFGFSYGDGEIDKDSERVTALKNDYQTIETSNQSN